MNITIQMNNLTEAQALAIEDLFATWMQLGSMGSSRWTAFYVDGDGNFHPEITVNGNKPKRCELTDPKKRWRKFAFKRDGKLYGDEGYFIDFDSIAWKLREQKEKEHI